MHLYLHRSLLVLAQVINLTFCVVCIILLVRLLMAMMTNTFRMVQEKAQLEWRLLVTRHVVRPHVPSRTATISTTVTKPWILILHRAKRGFHTQHSLSLSEVL